MRRKNRKAIKKPAKNTNFTYTTRKSFCVILLFAKKTKKHQQQRDHKSICVRCFV